MAQLNGAATSVDLSVELGPIRLKNPLIAASGCYNRGSEYARIADIGAWGAITLKSVTRAPRLGNPTPRVANTPSGLLNAIGLQGPGIAYFMEHEAPKLTQVPTAVIASAAGFSVEEFAEVAQRLDGLPNVVAIELDMSCPNVENEGGACFAADASATAAVVAAVKRSVKLPVIAKLTPNVADIRPIARAAETAGADALSLINSLRGMAVDVAHAEPALANVFGGLTGPAIRPVALAMVWDAAAAVKIPIIGMGGIETEHDALEFLMAGATALGIGTAVFRDPLVHIRIADELRAELASRGLASLRSLTGLARRGARTPA